MRRLKLSPAPAGSRSPRHRWEAACAGQIPAEGLSTRDREELVQQLHERGWTDVQIATHTYMTTYTTARIRARLGLAARPHAKENVA